MAGSSSGLLRFLIAGLPALAMTALLTAPSGVAAAGLNEVAVVESINGNASGVQFMDYLHAGQVIRLAPHETMVLSYRASCVRETITGGTVTIGIDGSQVQAGEIKRWRCGAGKMVLTGAQNDIGGRPFRGAAPAQPEQSTTMKSCDTGDCSSLPGPSDSAARKKPALWAKAVDSVKSALHASCDGNKCTFELPLKK
jgi:hypothetical protein